MTSLMVHYVYSQPNIDIYWPMKGYIYDKNKVNPPDRFQDIYAFHMLDGWRKTRPGQRL